MSFLSLFGAGAVLLYSTLRLVALGTLEIVMNKISLEILECSENSPLIIDNYEFRNTSLIKMSIDNQCIWHIFSLKDAVVVYSELQKTLTGKGLYLIFTSVTGIADEGGWEGVFVDFKDKKISWSSEVNTENFFYEFELEQYSNEINKIITSKLLYPLEPTEIFFPETWE